MKVIIAERVADVCLEILRQELEVDVRFGIKQEELLDIIEDYDALIVRSVIKVNEELLKKAKKLKVVGRAGNGIDNIDVPACTRYGVLAVNTPESNTISAAEHTIALLLSAIRNIPRATQQLKSGGWDRTPFQGVELYGKTVGIVGLGRIGSMVATRLAAFGMKVIAYDPYITEERFKRFGAERITDLNELVRRSDVITVHTPRTEETMGMIGEEQFKVAKRGVIVVNCARGGIINEAALIKAMNEGIVAYAGIDVFEKEPSPGNPIFQLEKIAVTPHLGADTAEAQYRVGATIATQVLNALKGQIVPNALNLPTLLEEELAGVKPYLCLAEKLGKLYFQLEKEPVERVELMYYGEISKKEVDMVTVSFLKGLLEPVIGEKVNYVNAPLLAESRGIKVLTSKDERTKEGFVNLIEANVIGKTTRLHLAGTLSGNNEPRIVKVDGYATDITPTENVLFVENIDRPGVIGAFAIILGQKNVNIAMMQVGRQHKGETALMTLNVDNEVDVTTVQDLRKVDGILNVKVVKF
ncbi:MAG: phosphoglycerate dehydrogenase [Firmicutes bacterium]|nr:phosphoglycerate dehydrogenase [Bacillota bacterium]